MWAEKCKSSPELLRGHSFLQAHVSTILRLRNRDGPGLFSQLLLRHLGGSALSLSFLLWKMGWHYKRGASGMAVSLLKCNLMFRLCVFKEKCGKQVLYFVIISFEMHL